jgi:integrase/recombinase XerD
MTPLRQAVADYLAMRRGLGFKLRRADALLPDFVAHLERCRARTVTCDLALEWAMRPPGAHPAWWVTRLEVVRGFASYLQAFDPSTEVPAPELLRGRYRRATPYLYSQSDIARLFGATRKLCSSQRAATLNTLIGLLATAGLRVGEGIRLDREDVDWHRRLLVIRETKFGKSREVPLHDSTLEALHAYARLRDRIFRRATTPAFFVSTVGTRLFHENIYKLFQHAVRAAGLQPRSPRRRPRFHDFRHTFAITTLLAWYRAGEDVDARLPQLSTYLGHVDPAATYWYLSASPELLALTARRLERASEVLR